MSLKITYKYDCDVCGAVIREESFDIAADCPAQNTTIPQPRLHGMGFGNHMACPNCISTGIKAAIKSVAPESE